MGEMINSTLNRERESVCGIKIPKEPLAESGGTWSSVVALVRWKLAIINNKYTPQGG